MAINQLGRVNFPDLTRYLVRADDMDLVQQYIENQLKEIALGLYSTGVVYGGEVSVNAGLTLDVAKLLANYSGQLVTFDDNTVTLTAADATHPRIDRIELSFALANNDTVLNIDNQSKTLDKIYEGTLVATAGTPAASPSAPAATGGRITLALVRVNASQTLLTAASIDQSDAARDLARIKDPSLRTLTIANNQSSFADIQDLKLNSALSSSVKIFGDLYRVTSSSELRGYVELFAQFKDTAGTWQMVGTVHGDDCGVEFEIDSTTGQLTYKSTNMGGTGYVGTLSVKQILI